MSTFAAQSTYKKADLAAGHPTSQVSTGRDWIGYWLTVLYLWLLPIQRLMLPFGLTVADLVLILLTLYSFGRAWRTHRRLNFPLLLPMWLILLSSLIATLVGFAHPDSIIAIVQEIYIFVWFLALTNLLRTFPPSDLDRLLKVWCVVACLESVTTLMGMFRVGPSAFYIKPTLDPHTMRDPNAGADLTRSIGTFVNANAVGVYLSVSFFALLATSWPIWLRLTLGGWIFAGMFGTGSNGALLSTAGSFVLLVGVYLIVQNRRDIKLLGAVMGMGMGIAAVVLFMLGFSPSLLSGVGLDARDPLLFQTLGRVSHSLATRLDIGAWAWETYRRHLWGTGPNSFASLGGSLHSDYIAFWFERGPLGIIGWLWLIGATLLRSLQVVSQLVDRHRRWQVLALGAGFLACAMNAFTHEVSHMRQVWTLLVFLFALSYANIAHQATHSQDDAG